jgi:hypothetical protein
MVAIDWVKRIIGIIGSLGYLVWEVYCKIVDVFITLEMVWEPSVRRVEAV